ncbi:glycogen synthase [Nitrosococcus oceani]|uniref:glycogen synthase n=1 Tax=Nitrosococcus oceani TaxID=1229 RepID=UPI0004E907A8|nr:glycogen synthase [Nitrosococcus oceani]KFI24046.1 glycogen synthase [Nitrosococcus oceani]
MYIVMITPECAPIAKVGGLGDVVQGLSNELSIRGNTVELILPKYDCMRYERIWGLEKTYNNLWVPYHDQWIPCDVYFGFAEGLKCFFIEPHNGFFQRGTYYGQPDDPQRFAFFCKAALEFMLRSNKYPEIIHCHDWQTGLVPVLLFEQYKYLGMTHPRVCYTLHNMRHQGVTGGHILQQVGLDPAAYMTPERLLDHTYPHGVNLMKGGIVFSNFITTVSPRYLDEIRYTDQGYGLQHTLHEHSQKLGGILNGVDYKVWNPDIDPYIAARYNLKTLDKKYENKTALRHRLWLRDEYKPIVGVISRLDPQKGVELIRHALFYCLANGCQFVLLGASASNSINADFWYLKQYLNDDPDCHLEIGYDEDLAHQIYAGADMLIVPSIYEPCGLTQMIAMKYGTVPIVRHVGGLADTVFDANYAHKPYHERNGFVFHDFNHEGIEAALHRAIGLWYEYPQYFRELMENGMRYDFSWNHPGQHYLNIYHHIQEI